MNTIIHCIIPVWKRPEITVKCMNMMVESIHHAKEYEIDLRLYYVYSSMADLGVLMFDSCHWDKVEGIYAENKPLGNKMNKAVWHLLTKYEPTPNDYIMTMGSDDEIDYRAWKVISEEISVGTVAFGFTDVTFVNEATGDQFSASYDVVCGAGRCMRIKEILQCGAMHPFRCIESNASSFGSFIKDNIYWLPEILLDNLKSSPYFIEISNEIIFELWPPDINQGLDTASGERFERFYPIKQIKGPYITDYKSDVNIHSYESMKGMLGG